VKPTPGTEKKTETSPWTFRGRTGQRVPKEQRGTWETHPGDGKGHQASSGTNNALELPGMGVGGARSSEERLERVWSQGALAESERTQKNTGLIDRTI